MLFIHKLIFIFVFIFITIYLSYVYSFEPAKTTCLEANCYSQSISNDFLTVTNESRCSRDDCINTILIQTYKQLIESKRQIKRNNPNYYDIKNDYNKLMIIACNKLNTIKRITISLNLNGEIRKSSFAFTFLLKKNQCLDCDDNSIQLFHNWKDSSNLCHAFKFEINKQLNESKEILYIDTIGYYLTVKTKCKSKKDIILYSASTEQFIYPQTLPKERFSECKVSNDNCLFFRGEDVNDECKEQKDCTGRLMIYDFNKNQNKLFQLDLANPLNSSLSFYIFLIKPTQSITSKKIYSIFISSKKTVKILALKEGLDGILENYGASGIIELEDQSDKYLKWIIKGNYEQIIKLWNLEDQKFTLKFYGGFDSRQVNFFILDYFKTEESKPFGEIPFTTVPITQKTFTTETIYFPYFNYSSSSETPILTEDPLTPVPSELTTELTTELITELETELTTESTTLNSRTINESHTYQITNKSDTYQTQSNNLTTNSSIVPNDEKYSTDNYLKRQWKSLKEHFVPLLIFLALCVATMCIFSIFCLVRLSRKDTPNAAKKNRRKKVLKSGESTVENTLIETTESSKVDPKSKSKKHSKVKNKEKHNHVEKLKSKGYLKNKIDMLLKNMHEAKKQLEQNRSGDIVKELRSLKPNKKRKHVNSKDDKKDEKENSPIVKKLFKFNKLKKEDTHRILKLDNKDVKLKSILKSPLSETISSEIPRKKLTIAKKSIRKYMQNKTKDPKINTKDIKENKENKEIKENKEKKELFKEFATDASKTESTIQESDFNNDLKFHHLSDF